MYSSCSPRPRKRFQKRRKSKFCKKKTLIINLLKTILLYGMAKTFLGTRTGMEQINCRFYRCHVFFFFCNFCARATSHQHERAQKNVFSHLKGARSWKKKCIRAPSNTLVKHTLKTSTQVSIFFNNALRI